MSNYMLYPPTVKELAEQLIIICNDYRSRVIDDKKTKELIVWYATSVPDKLFEAGNLNPTVKKIVGKKREHMILSMLDGYQFNFGGLINVR